MTIYRVATPPVDKLDGDQKLVDSIVHVRFAPSDSAARKFRRELAKMCSFKLDDVSISTVDVKLGKTGFIAYMNAFHAQAPAGYSPAGYAKLRS